MTESEHFPERKEKWGETKGNEEEEWVPSEEAGENEHGEEKNLEKSWSFRVVGTIGVRAREKKGEDGRPRFAISTIINCRNETWKRERGSIRGPTRILEDGRTAVTP